MRQEELRTGGGDVEATELDQLMQDIEDDKNPCWIHPVAQKNRPTKQKERRYDQLLGKSKVFTVLKVIIRSALLIFSMRVRTRHTERVHHARNSYGEIFERNKFLLT